MKTNRYCPICSKRLREVGKPGERANFVECKNGHVWKWKIEDREIFRLVIGEEENE